MKADWRTFKKDPYFFLKYFFTQMATSLAIFGCLYWLRSPLSETLELSLWHLVVVSVAVVIGIQLPAMLHNAVHFNWRPLWLNEVVGEVGGFFVLFGLGPFRISHFLHHAFADSDRDPHPPEGKGFLHFLGMTQLNTIRVIRKEFLTLHGNTTKMHAVLAVEMTFYYVSVMARLLCWYWLLGPSLFLMFYVPAYVTNVLVFAHINFATHKTLADGSVEIVNLNDNLWYKAVNWIGSGVYFHKNHHLKPNLYNPSKLGAVSGRAPLSVMDRVAGRYQFPLRLSVLQTATKASPPTARRAAR